jgi:hypothetical protein
VVQETEESGIDGSVILSQYPEARVISGETEEQSRTIFALSNLTNLMKLSLRLWSLGIIHKWMEL